MAELDQWVNIPSRDRFRKDGIDDLQRIGALHFKFKFKKAKPSNFRVKLEPVGTPAAYSDDERNRNENFRVRVATKIQSNAAKDTSSIDKAVSLPAAGGNKFKLMALHKGKQVDSPVEVIVKRRLYYQTMAMKGETAHATTTMDDAFWCPGKNLFIQMLAKEAGKTIDLITVLDDAKGDDFIRACGAVFKLGKFKPFAFGICYVRYIADPGETTITHRQALNVPSKLGKWTWAGATAELEVGEHLWHGFDDAEDAAHKWLLGLDIGFVPKGAADTAAEAIPDTAWKVDIAGTKEFKYGGYSKISITLIDGAIERKLAKAREGTLIISAKIKTTTGWTNGFAYNTINLIAIANRIVWRDMGAATREYTLNHEVGHKVGMVSDGTGKAVEKPPNHYTGQGHQGNHCSKGATPTYDAVKQRWYWDGAPGCVMFGANGAYSGTTLNDAPATFCPDCEPRVRKLDLSSSFLSGAGFKTSMETF